MKIYKIFFPLTLLFALTVSVYAQTSLTVAVIQSESKAGMVEKNLEHAYYLAEEAAQAGARFILFPELMPSGYITDRNCWDSAEPFDGPTVQWLKHTAMDLKIWCGTSFIEVEGKDFYNTFVLAGPEGSIEGKVRKQWLAAHEFFCTTSFKAPHIIETDFGKIGVAICYEGTIRRLMEELKEARVDLVLLPTADPVPEFAKDDNPTEWDHDLRDTAVLWASVLGVPALLANQAGLWVAKMPGLLPNQDSSFRGQSAIADYDGSLVAALDQEEGIALGTVHSNPLGSNTGEVPRYGRYCKPMPFFSRVYQVFVSAAGRTSYGLSVERRKKVVDRSGDEL